MTSIFRGPPTLSLSPSHPRGIRPLEIIVFSTSGGSLPIPISLFSPLSTRSRRTGKRNRLAGARGLVLPPSWELSLPISLSLVRFTSIRPTADKYLSSCLPSRRESLDSKGFISLRDRQFDRALSPSVCAADVVHYDFEEFLSNDSMRMHSKTIESGLPDFRVQAVNTARLHQHVNQ